MDCFILPSPAPLFAQAAPVRSLRCLVLVMAAPAAALAEALAAMEAADAAGLAAAPAAEAAHPAGAPAAEAAHPAEAAPAAAEAAAEAPAEAGPPDGAPLIEDYDEAEHGDCGPGEWCPNLQLTLSLLPKLPRLLLPSASEWISLSAFSLSA